jgi:hypothetical protein
MPSVLLPRYECTSHLFDAEVATNIINEKTVGQDGAPGPNAQKTVDMNNPNSNPQKHPLPDKPSVPSTGQHSNPRYPLRSASSTPSAGQPPQPPQPAQASSWNAINNPYAEQWAQYYANVAAHNQYAVQGYGWQQYNGGYPTTSYYGQLSPFAHLGIYSTQALSFAQPYAHSQYSSQGSLQTQMQYDSLRRARAYKAKSFKINKRNRPNANGFVPSQAMNSTFDALPQSIELERAEQALEALEATKPQLSAKEKKEAKRDKKIMLPAPQPTPEYLAQAAEEPFVIDPPERLLVILDLNGTLIFRPNRNHPTRLVSRPFLKPFLRYLFDNFSVIVWSSARPENVKVIVENVLDKDLRSMLVACLARDSFGLSSEHYTQNVQVYKDLNIIWNREEIQRQIPDYEFGKRFGQHNTILIDDSVLKASAQPHNLLLIPEFAASKEDMKSDVLREVAGYLEVLKMQWDVSKFMRKEPFEANGRWQYDWEDESAPGGELRQKVSARD